MSKSNVTKKLKIQKDDLQLIARAANSKFNDAESFSGFSSTDIQAYLFLTGVEALLKSKGIEIPFEIDISTKRYK